MSSPRPAPRPGPPRADAAFLRRVLIAIAFVALALLLWQVRATLLLVFAGMVVCVLLLALARPLEQRLGLARGVALALVAVALCALLGLVGASIGGEALAQARDLAIRLPDLVQVAREYGLRLPWSPSPDGGQPDGVGLSAVGTVAQEVMGLGAGLLNALSALVVAVVGGFFLAADPRMYRRGVVTLLPHRLRGQALRAMVACGRALRLWMGAQLASMVFVGVLSGLGTWALGLPAPLALGLFAGLSNVVPFIGAFAGAVPAVLLALTGGLSLALWTSALFLAVQQLESNLVTPLIQRRMVSLPPALVVFAVVAVGTLFGLPGVILAAPVTVVGFVLVKQLYVREALDTPTDVPGEPG